MRHHAFLRTIAIPHSVVAITSAVVAKIVPVNLLTALLHPLVFPSIRSPLNLLQSIVAIHPSIVATASIAVAHIIISLKVPFLQLLLCVCFNYSNTQPNPFQLNLADYLKQPTNWNTAFESPDTRTRRLEDSPYEISCP